MSTRNIINMCIFAAAFLAVISALCICSTGEDTDAIFVQDDIVYEEIDDTKVTVIGFETKVSKNVVIPDEAWYDVEKKYKVVGIGKGAQLSDWDVIKIESITVGDNVSYILNQSFCNCDSLVSVTFGSNLENIDQSVFEGCTSLESVKFNSSLKNIGVYAFKDCTSLKSIDLSKGVTSICSRAFYDCESVEYVLLSDNVSFIDNEAFCGLSDLKFLSVPDNPNWNSSNLGDNIFGIWEFEDKSSSLIYFKNSNFCNNAYSLNNDSLLNACDLFYVGEKTDKDVTAAYNLRSMEMFIFGNGEMRDYETTPFSGFVIGAVTILDGVDNVGAHLFDGITSVQTVVFPSSIKWIGECAFKKCINLREIDLSLTSAYIGNGAFSMGNSDLVVTNYVAVIKLGNATYISECAFYGCGYNDIPSFSGVTELTIPGSVTFIGKDAFSYMLKLSKLTVENNADWNPENIMHDAFSCITDVGDYFYILSGCVYEGADSQLTLKTVTYQIGKDDPSEMTATLTLSTGTMVLSGKGQMKDWTSENLPPWTDFKDLIVSIDFGDVSDIGNYAFFDCTSLEYVVFPGTIRSVGDFAFGKCSGLFTISVDLNPYWNSTNISKNCFDYTFYDFNGKKMDFTNTSGCVYVLDTFGFRLRDISYAIGQDDPYDMIAVLDGITKVMTISGTGDMKDWTLEELPPWVNDGRNCVLKTVVFIGTINSIGDCAFAYCEDLSDPGFDSVPIIGARAYYYNVAIKSVDVSNKTFIGDFAFLGSNLKEVKVGGCLTYLGDYAFESPLINTITVNADPNWDEAVSSSAFGNTAFCKEYGNQIKVESSDFPGYTYVGDETKKERVYEYDVGLGSDHVIAKLCSVSGSMTLDSDISGSQMCDFIDPSFCPWYGLRECILSLYVSNNVISIGNNAFYSCVNLQQIHFGDNVSYISIYSFYGCSSLTSITLPKSNIALYDHAFFMCSSLSNVIIYSTSLKCYTTAFLSCPSLSTISIGKYLESTSDTFGSMLYEIESLTKIDVDPENQHYCSVDGVLFDHDVTALLAYPHAKAGSTYQIPSTVQVLGDYAMARSANLTEVDTSLCTGLLRISDYAFVTSSSLSSLTLPSSVNSIGDNAFASCSSLHLTVLNTAPSAITFDSDSLSYIAAIYVPTDTLNAYQTTAPWSYHTSIIFEKISDPVAKSLTYDDTEQQCMDDSAKYTLGKTYRAVDAGDYVASVTPTAGYCWSTGDNASKDLDWTIGKADLESVTIADGVNFYYKGSQITPLFDQLVITAPGTVASDDVTITAENNIYAGKAKVTVTANTDSKNYKGSVSSNFTIEAKSVTVIQGAVAPTKEYDGSTSYTLIDDNYSIEGLCSGDEVSLVGTAAFDSAHVLIASSVDVQSMSLAGQMAYNYSLSTSVLHLEGASITPKSLTAGPADQCIPSKIYDGIIIWEPAGEDHYVLTGIIGDDQVSLAGVYVFDSEDTDARSVSAMGLSLNGVKSSNYVLSNKGFTYPEAHILPMAITVTPDSGQSKIFGQKDPSFTYTNGPAITGQTPAFSGALSRGSGEDVGSYQITKGTLVFAENGSFKPSNYTMELTPDVMFDITVKEITKGDFSIDLSDETYDGKEKTKTITSDLRSGTDYSVSYSDNINVGTATITIVGKGNYSGTLTYEFSIIKMSVDIPAPLYYIVTGQKIVFSDFPVSPYYYETTGNDRSGTDAGTYPYRLALTDTGNTCWIDASYNGDYFVYITVETKTYVAGDVTVAELDFFEKGVRVDGELQLTGTYDVKEDTKVILKDVSGEIQFSYDIKIVADGKEIQPAGKVTVKILVPEDVSASSFSIYHIHGGTYEKVDHHMDGQYAVFTVDSFSEFVFVKDAHQPLSTEMIVLYVALGIAAFIAAVLMCVYFIRKH